MNPYSIRIGIPLPVNLALPTEIKRNKLNATARDSAVLACSGVGFAKTGFGEAGFGERETIRKLWFYAYDYL
jgi:hypothetical protein